MEFAGEFASPACNDSLWKLVDWANQTGRYFDSIKIDRYL